MIRYTTRYVHKIAPRDTDTGPEITLGTDFDPTDRSALALVLRVKGMLSPGERLRSSRREADGCIVAFTGRRSVWHAIVLTPLPLALHDGGAL